MSMTMGNNKEVQLRLSLVAPRDKRRLLLWRRRRRPWKAGIVVLVALVAAGGAFGWTLHPPPCPSRHCLKQRQPFRFAPNTRTATTTTVVCTAIISNKKRSHYDYDLIIIGAGASGLFASGASTSLGSKTLLLDHAEHGHLGGDCTNAACVPSKALRSIANMARKQETATTTTTTRTTTTKTSWLDVARQHCNNTVFSVRQRENVAQLQDRTPKLDVVLVDDCHFVSPHEVELTTTTATTASPRNSTKAVATTLPPAWSSSSSSSDSNNNTNTTTTRTVVTGRRFLIATGASPVVPLHLKEAAQATNVPLFTYRSVLQPSLTNDEMVSSIWNALQKEQTALSSRKGGKMSTRTTTKHLVIAGGGPTACELGQSLARLCRRATNDNDDYSGCAKVIVTIVAPEILPSYDVSLRRAAMKVLTLNDDDSDSSSSNVVLRLGSRVTDVVVGQAKDEGSGTMGGSAAGAQVELDHGRHYVPVDVLLVCVGRSPETSLASLNLTAAGVHWSPHLGVEVSKSSLQSKTAPHAYACGDCCSAAVHDRRAAHAAWTGFHAARNTALPYWLQVGSQAVHPVVPAVIYTDPELACVGLSYADCVGKYGSGGFDLLYVPEEGMDRADMERLERPVIGFVELRATKISGRILGMTACGPAAAELANEVGLAIMSGLTVRDMARAIHSYPSHGYLLYRIALALATSNVLGLLSACGPTGKVLGGLGRVSWQTYAAVRHLQVWKRSRTRKETRWESEGSRKAILLGCNDGVVNNVNLEQEKTRLLSYLELYSDEGDLLNDVSVIDGDTTSLASSESMEHPPPSILSVDEMARWIRRKP